MAPRRACPWIRRIVQLADRMWAVGPLCGREALASQKDFGICSRHFDRPGGSRQDDVTGTSRDQLRRASYLDRDRH
jgi:hypothetical protein